jgi:hypothetical protein
MAGPPSSKSNSNYWTGYMGIRIFESPQPTFNLKKIPTTIFLKTVHSYFAGKILTCFHKEDWMKSKNALFFSVIAGIACFIAGCSSTPAVKKGDSFEVLSELREAASTHWEQPFTDGFTKVIPPGTVLQAVADPQAGAEFFECVPVSVNGNKDPEYINTFFVPEGTRLRAGFQGFSFNLPMKYIGDKLKKF